MVRNGPEPIGQSAAHGTASVRAALSRPERSLLVAAALLGALALLLPALPQDPHYHHFADARTLLGVPNALDVLSNIPFLIGGAAGLWLHVHGRLFYANHAMAAAGLVLFAGFMLTALGSGYYHLAPNNARLAWDRTGMVVAFAGVLGLAVAHRVSVRAARIALPLALLSGALAVAWYAVTGSVTPYAVLQFGGIGVVAAMLWVPGHGRGPNLAAILGTYALAKVLELGDAEMFALSGGIVSGHTAKHVVSALAIMPVLLPLLHPSPPRSYAGNAHAPR